MKLRHVARLPSLFVFGLLVLMWQGCDDDNTGEKEGGIAYADAGERDAGDKADSGSGSTAKDAGDESGGSGDSGAAGASGSGGTTAGSGGEAAGRGGAGGKSGGKAGAGGAGGAGGKGAGGKGGAGGKSGAGAGGSAGGAAGSGGAGAGGAAGGGGAAGEAAGAGGESGTGEAGSGGDSGAGEGGSDGGGEAGGGGSDAGEPSADRCGTRGGVECGDGQFCNFEPDQDCGGTDRGGVCEEVPEICNDLEQPVCGCDNRTHANSCYAHRAGVSVKHDGLCTPDECQSVGGRAVFSDGASTPECAQGEQTWSISGGDEPVVCCLPEQTSGRTCGGIATLECEDGEFCNYETDAGGQGCDGMVADAGGKCQSIATGCPSDYEPVCGCDKKSYDNACEAHASGMSILHDGACTELDCASVAGRVVFGTGPAPMCAPGEDEWTSVVDSSGVMAIEGAICCRQQ